MQAVASLISGLIFGLGLILSGMTNPQKVQNFLDILGAWDPSLAFVMAGAVIVAALGFVALRRKDKPIFADKFDLPSSITIDRRLVAGAAIFGIGWGLSGFCPGPAPTSTSLMATGTLVFLPAMLLGMWIGRQFKERDF